MNIRHKIATDIFVSGWLTTQCNKVCKDEMLAEDLMQEVLLIILEYKPESALDNAYRDGKHLGLIVNIIRNNYNSTSSPFYTKYRKNLGIELIEDITGEDDNED